MDRLHLLATGRVQGVFYRATAVQVARDLGLRGWVRNLPDGRVEAVAEAPREALDAFVAWARRGPEHARVDDLAAVWAPATGEFAGFEVR